MRQLKYGLIACCKKKLAHPAPAGELYQSDLFKKAYQYCQRHYDGWSVLSALYGLVSCDTVIAPYDVTLNTFSSKQVDEWAVMVANQLKPYTQEGVTFYVHAGRKYQSICRHLPEYVIPLQGMGIGEQLAWYKSQKILSSDEL